MYLKNSVHILIAANFVLIPFSGENGL